MAAIHQWSLPIEESEREEWDRRLETGEFPGLVMEEESSSRECQVTAFCTSQEEAEALRARFGGTICEFPEQDWVAAGSETWRGRFLEIGRDLLVSLDERKEFLAELEARFPDRVRLCIPPEMAFGTGDHETTSACLELLSEFARKHAEGWRLLDLGTGSGVLALAAVRLGAGNVVATELDEVALRVARRNAERNGLSSGRIEFRKEDVLDELPEGRFDLICANLFSEILRGLIPRLVGRLSPGGRLCLSGIRSDQEAGVSEVLEETDFQVLDRRPQGNWVTLWVRERQSGD